MEQAWVYMLLCGPQEKIYIGWTNDPQARLIKHQSGKGGKFTRANQPVRMVGLLECEDRSAAMSLEVKLKQLGRKEKLAWISKHPFPPS